MTQRRRRYGWRRAGTPRGAGIVGLAGAALVLTSCVTMPEERSAEGATWEPATHERAVEFLAHYDDVLAEASAERDAEAAAAVVGGPLAERRAAMYQVAEFRDPEMDDPPSVWRHTQPSILIPAVEEYPAWFVAVSDMQSEEGDDAGAEEGDEGGDGADDDSAEEYRNIGVVQRGDASKPWKKVASIDVLLEELPSFGPDDELVEVVDAEDGEGLQLSPAQLVDAVANALADPDADALEHFEMNDAIARQHNRLDAGDQPITISSTYSPENGPYTVRTADDGALVVVSFLETQEVRLTDGGRIAASEGSTLEALAGGKTETRRLLTIETLHDVAVQLPTAGGADAEAGKAVLLGVGSTDVAVNFH